MSHLVVINQEIRKGTRSIDMKNNQRKEILYIGNQTAMDHILSLLRYLSFIHLIQVVHLKSFIYAINLEIIEGIKSIEI
jgi:hypothetical protein